MMQIQEPVSSAPLPESEGERHLARMNYRYPQQSESQALQEHVDKMRVKLKSLAYSLDPSGPVPDIVIPDRKKWVPIFLKIYSDLQKYWIHRIYLLYFNTFDSEGFLLKEK